MLQGQAAVMVLVANIEIHFVNFYHIFDRGGFKYYESTSHPPFRKEKLIKVTFCYTNSVFFFVLLIFFR